MKVNLHILHMFEGTFLLDSDPISLSLPSSNSHAGPLPICCLSSKFVVTWFLFSAHLLMMRYISTTFPVNLSSTALKFLHGHKFILTLDYKR